MLIVQHTLVSPLNPPVVGIIAAYQSFISSPGQWEHFDIKEREREKKKPLLKKLFHLIANLRLHNIFWPNFPPYSSGNLGVL